MLNKLIIKNVALIDYAEIEFNNNLNVLSGETGAGKSVIIESLNFALGAKADRSIIRHGENECFVSAEFNVSDNETINHIYDEFDFERDDLLIINRKFSLDGKTSIKINGNTATVSMLKKFTSQLVDVHGQSEHFNLLSEKKQLELIDNFAGEEFDLVFKRASELYRQYRDVINQINELGGDENERLIRLDILNFQINEISQLSLKPGEEDELLALRSKIKHQEKISIALSSICNGYFDEGGINDVLGNCNKNLSSITDFSEDYKNLYERLDSVYSEIQDIADTASDFLSSLSNDDIDIDYVEKRLDDIKNLKRKYGNNFDEINSFFNIAKKEKEKLENFNELYSNLIEEKKLIEANLYKSYVNLSILRRKTAETFEKNVLAELKTLGMQNALFSVEFSDMPPLEDCTFSSSNGFDNIAFMFSANKGEPLKPLSFVISGGEMSRFMLAIKTQTSKISDVSTFIFDEIDSGISGHTAKIVAEKFALISRNSQLIAITHLPQISAMADNNLLIKKEDVVDRVKTLVQKLGDEEKVLEIARLISGNESSDLAIAHAKELIENAKEFKNSL